MIDSRRKKRGAGGGGGGGAGGGGDLGGVIGESVRVLDHITAKRLNEKHFLRVFFLD